VHGAVVIVIVWGLDLQLPVHPVYDEVDSIHYMIKIVSDLRQVDGFLPVLRFPPPIKLTAMI